LPRETRVADIMRAAKSVFIVKGYEDASISEIAIGANVVEGTIYRYFENKRALLIRVVEDWYEEMLSDYDERLRGIRGTWNRLRFMIWKHLSSIHDEPDLCRLMFQVIRSGADYRKTGVFDLNRQYTRRTLDIVRDAVTAGEFRQDISLPIVRDMIYGCVEHHTFAYLRGEGDFAVNATADAITDILCRGLAADAVPVGPILESGVARRLEDVAAKLERLGAEFDARIRR